MIKRSQNKILLFLIVFIYYSITVCAEKQKITIFMKQSDIPWNLLNEDWDRYKNELNEYFEEQTKNDEKLNNYKLDIVYYIPEENDNTNDQSSELVYMNYLSDQLPTGEFDLIILNERILFNEMAFMENEDIIINNRYKKPSFELLHDLTGYINQKDLKFHDSKILSGGTYDNKTIGIPYEYDFDVMYYRNEEEYSKAYNDTQGLLENMEKYSWAELLRQIDKNSQAFKISLSDDNDLLNLIIEYTSDYYNIPSKYNPNHIKMFYNGTSVYFTKLRDLIKSVSVNNDVKNVPLTTLDDSYKIFLGGNSTFFKAKASYNTLFKSNNTTNEIPLTLPPKNRSATTFKYLVANKFSKIEPDILSSIILLLTSKEAQLYRSKKFGNIPTFDFSKKKSDSDLQTYCEDNPTLCQCLDKIKQINIRDIFNSETAVSFYEILCYAPAEYKNYFISNNLDNIKNFLISMNEFITDHLGIYKTLSLLVVALAIIFFIYFMYLNYKFREHPYVKVLSPLFSNLIIIGCIISMLRFIKFLPPFSNSKIKLFLIVDAISTNLIFIPMFAIIYRIYMVFKTKSFSSTMISNTRLLICTLSVIMISIIYSLIVITSCNFYYKSLGSINVARIPVGLYTNYETYSIINQAYLTFIVCIIFKNIYFLLFYIQ